ncbi:MAG: hypothetical protein GY801_25545, partial [bacterium]|nr:hypothetical protein [bacterium]
ADFLQMNPLPEASPDEKLHQFLLAEGKNFSASTINQIVSAIRRFYRETEGITIKPFHAKTPQRLIEELPVSLVNQVIDSLPLPHSLMAILLAGSGLNLADCLSLRTQNIQQSRFVWPLYSPIMPQRAIPLLEEQAQLDSEWIFPSKSDRSRHLSRAAWQYAVRKLPVTAAQLRAFFIYSQFRSGYNVVEVQAWTGLSAATLMKYLSGILPDSIRSPLDF